MERDGRHVDQVLGLALPFFGLIFIGFAAAKLRPLPAEGLAWLNVFIVYVALPALFFRLLSTTPIEELANWAYVATTTGATLAVFAAAFAFGRLSGSIPEATVTGFAGAYSNIGYMGPGLTLAAFGPAAVVPTALVFCFDNALHFTLAPLLMGLAAGGDSPVRVVLLILKRIFTHPFILATIAGVGAAAVGFQPPVFVDKMLQLLAQAAAPCALFTLGVTVGLRPLGRVPPEIPAALVLKLVIHPVLVYLLLETVGGFDRIWVETAILMAALPPALNVFVIAQQYGVAVERASTTVLIGTVVSVLTVTGLLYLITHDQLPHGLLRPAPAAAAPR